MAELEIADNKLIVHIRGVDKFFALASRIEVPPLEHISSVEVNPAEAHQIWHGMRVGTNLVHYGHGPRTHDPVKRSCYRLRLGNESDAWG
jgi:hypothetical protein